MDLFLIFILAIIIILGVPIGLSILIYLIIKKRKLNRKFQLLALIPILTISYIIYDAIYPSDSFYKEDFYEVTKIKFPENGDIIYKTATFPDQFGDYTSISISKIDKSDFRNILLKLKKNGFKNLDEVSINPKEESLLKNLSEGHQIKTKLSILSTGKIYTVCFMTDEKTIYVERTSW